MTAGMKRRDVLTLLSGAAALPLLRPRAARAQQAMPVIGFLSSASPDAAVKPARSFRQGLAEAGYVEGRNVIIEYRWAEGTDRLPEMAADLVRRQVTVIATAGATPAALAAKVATATIPIVFQIGTDPVEVGLVASLNRPGKNVTGVTSLNRALSPKRLEVLHELLPAATSMAQLFNLTNKTAVETQLADARAAARTLGLELHVLQASSEGEFDKVFAALAQLRAGGLVIAPDPLFSNRSDLLASLAIRQRMPTISPYRQFVAAGGLMSYGGDLLDQFRQVGVYTGRILKGEKPADLPVEQATKIELLINLKTAKALGLTFPLSLLGRADEVIE